jgi:hypothetical protein
MRKLLLVLSILCTALCSSFAQSFPSKNAKFSVGVDLGLPVGNAANGYSFGIGGSLKYEIPAATNLMVTLSGGYESLNVKTDFFPNSGLPSSFGFIPLKAGLKYYINDGFFGEGQIGVAISTESGGGSAFAYAPGAGYTFDNGFEVGVRYEGWSKQGVLSQIAARVAFRF